VIDGGLRVLFHKNLKGLHWQAVETGGTGLGIPDSNFAGDGVEGWVEFKKTSTMAVGLSGPQVGWIESRLRHGGRVFVAVRHQTTAGPRKGPASDALWLYPGSEARNLLVHGLRSQNRLGYWPGPPVKWNWSEIRALLLS